MELIKRDFTQGISEELIEKVFKEASLNQLYWIHGYVSGLIKSKEAVGVIAIPEALSNGHSKVKTEPGLESPAINNVAVEKQTVTILFGTQSGNSKKIAAKLKEIAESKGLKIKLTDMVDYNVRDLKNEKLLLIIVSTHGEGEPPLAAEELHEFIHSKKAPDLKGVKFSVLALGDKGYVHFCKTGADFDSQLEKLGAERIHNRIDCDVSYQKDADKWIDGVVAELDKLNQQQKASQPAASEVKQQTSSESVTESFTREKPGDLIVTEVINLNGRGSGKQTIHIELQDETGTLKYTPGDSLGIYFENDAELVKQILTKTGYKGDEKVKFESQEITLLHFLTYYAELTALNKDVLEKYAKLCLYSRLTDIAASPQLLSDYIFGRDILDLITEFPSRISASEFVSFIRPMQPRLYSISSSYDYAPSEVHLTIASLQYEFNQRRKKGACSGYVAGNVEVGQHLKAFVSVNDGFRLPDDSNADIIMVGPGTGVAPFRSFMQQREVNGDSGKNWLFFGDRQFTTDFIYQLEWQQWHKSKLLNKIDLAFSRDQAEKVYVQHKIKQNAKEFYQWLQNGAHIFVCGDKNNMAKDVHHAIIDVVEEQGKLTRDEAVEFVKSLRKQRRYHEDVY